MYCRSDKRKIITQEYKNIINEYKSQNIDEDDFIDITVSIFKKNKTNIINKNNCYFNEFKSSMGKKRIKLLEYALYKRNMLDLIGGEINEKTIV